MKNDDSKQDWTVFFSTSEQLAIDNLDLMAENIELQRKVEELNRKLDRLHANVHVNAKVELMNKIFEYRVKWVDSEWWGVVVRVDQDNVHSFQITDPNGKSLTPDSPMYYKLVDLVQNLNGGTHGD